MPSNTSTTTAVLKINGQEAKQTLNALQKQAQDLAVAMRKAMDAGDKKGAEKLRKELDATNNTIKKMQSSTANVTEVMKRLDKATPKELRSTLKTLNAQLATMDRGSAAWNKQTAAIRQVKEQLSQVNAELRANNSLSAKSSGGGFFKNIAGGLKAGAIGAGIAAITGTMRSLVQTNMEFEQSNANLASVLGTSRDNIKMLTEDAKRLGATTVKSASEVTELQTSLAKLGFSQNEIKASTEAILNFGIATGADLGGSAELVGATLRSFNLDASEAERVAATLAVSTTKSALSYEALSSSMSTVAPVASKFGFSVEDTVALLGKLSDAGFDASSAATATRNIFLNLADSNGKLAKELGRPIKSLDDLAPALQELNNKGVDLAEMLELTDKRSVAAFSTLVSGSDSLTKLRDSIMDCNGELKDMVNTQMNTLSGSVAGLKSAWEGLMLSFSGSNGVLKQITDGLTQILTLWAQWRKKNAGGDEAVAAFRKGNDANAITAQIDQALDHGSDREKILARAEARLKANKEKEAEQENIYKLLNQVQNQIGSGKDKDLSKFYEAYNELKEYGIYIDDINDIKQRDVEKLVKQYAEKVAFYQDKVEYWQIAFDHLQPPEVSTPTEQTTQNIPNTQNTPNTQTTPTVQSDPLAEIEDRMKREKAINDRAFAQGEKDQAEYKLRCMEIEKQYHSDRLATMEEGSTQYLQEQAALAKVEKEIVDAEAKAVADAEAAKAKAEEQALKQREANRKKFFGSVNLKSASDPEYQNQINALDTAKEEVMALATTDEQKLMIEQAYQAARYDLAKEYNDKIGMEMFTSAKESTEGLIEWLQTDGGKAFTETFSAITSTMGNLFSAASSLINAEADLETAQISNRYDKEIEAAEGNEEKIAELEQKKADEIAKVKQDASEKEYAMNVIQTIAQTAMAALNAYSSTAAIPLVGPFLAPAAAAAAMVVGGIQLAALKKQQEAAAAQGYAHGGYTKKGGVYEPAGIVHAGEWVASQKLLANPEAAATIATLDEAQRTNTIGSLNREYVTAMAAPVGMNQTTPNIPNTPNTPNTQTTPTVQSDLTAAIAKLNDRLNAPFVTVNTVAGDKGIKQAQDRYDILKRNAAK